MDSCCHTLTTCWQACMGARDVDTSLLILSQLETQGEEDAHYERRKWSWPEDHWRERFQIRGHGNLCTATGRRRSSFLVC